MSKWKTCTLAEIGEIVGGATPSTKDKLNYENGTISWITPKDLSTHSGRYISRGERMITENGMNSCSTRLLPKNSILFSSRAPIGYIAIAQNEMCTNQGFKSIIPNSDMDYLFIYYLLLFNKDNIENMGSGTTFKEVSGNTMKSINVSIPESIDEQRKIASILSSIDDKIELNNKINENLLQQAVAIFDNALEQSKHISHAELGSFADVKGGKRLPKGVNLITTPNLHPYIRVRDLNDVVFASLSANYEYVDDETQKTISRYITSTGDVLISIVGTIGLTAIVDKSLDKANLTENCVKVTNLRGVSPEYLILFLRSQNGVKEIQKGTVGAVQAKLPIKNIQSINIPLLPQSEMQSLNNTLTTLFSQISTNTAESKCLAGIRDSLLPQLMNGEIDVSEVQI